jgi:hypothetical protein
VTFWPESVTYWIGDRQTMDPAALEEKQLPGMDQEIGLPSF